MVEKGVKTGKMVAATDRIELTSGQFVSPLRVAPGSKILSKIQYSEVVYPHCNSCNYLIDKTALK